MKFLVLIFTILFSFNLISAQQNEISAPVSYQFRNFNKLNEVPKGEDFSVLPSNDSDETFENEKKILFPVNKEINFEAVTLEKTDFKSNETKFAQNKSGERFHWKPALLQSGIFLGVQHGFRLFQKKTRDEFGGKFFHDWGKSVKNLRGWNDGDSFFTNYIAHPIQGAITGRIFVNNSDRANKTEFGTSKTYWESRLKAFGWSTLYSFQFEMGPISEATIGNVGLRTKRGFSTMAWVDLVITPTVGTSWLIAEDVLEKYVLKNWLEKNFKNHIVIKFFRVLLAPTTSFGSILRGKYPWWREFRPLN